MRNGGIGMRAYIDNNREGLLSKLIVGAMFAVTFVAVALFDDVSPATMLFI